MKIYLLRNYFFNIICDTITSKSHRIAFLWKRTLGSCGTCPDLAAPPAGVEAVCSFNWMGKKKCTYKCANGENITASGSSFGGITSICACPRWNNRVCGWNTRKLDGMVTDSDVAGYSCPPAPGTTTAVPPLSTTAAPPASTSAVSATTGAPPASSTAAPASTTGPAPEFEPLTDNIKSTLTTCVNGNRSFEKIVGGIDATQTNWPWLARLFLVTNIGDMVGGGCGGAVINDEWVLTAAHCCENRTQVFATFNDASEGNLEDGEFERVSTQMFNHPMYGNVDDGNPQNMDLCLIKFSSPSISGPNSDGTSGTAHVCLSTAYPEHGKACWVAGWGHLVTGGPSPDLLKSVGVNIFSQEYCAANSVEEFPLPDDICAGIPDNNNNDLTDAGRDSCQGDSGGPLICDVNGAATLVGVVSRGGPVKGGCALEGYPGLYTAVHTDNWIAETIAANSS
ncbi:unnamed protein product [Oikopleura dioica]|uniref:Peptidase S1 domain-containing protein n=1 Tax=Oikopleura dioica TaxID=34765 RepID=E4YFM6_OIKDI|nr:unnamed protein product [Oikopleura dioica]